MAGIVLEGVGKTYGEESRAVADVNLEIGDGEFLVFVGPSGCGKSTLLRMIAGLEEISEGKITIGDRVVNDVQPKDRDIAMVFQNYALYPHMTVFDNMAFGLKLRRMDKGEIERRVGSAADLLEITDYLERKPKALSGGQRQRVAMGRAIVREPAAFLMDEPLSNLDAKLRVLMRTELGLLHERLETTTVYVTHDQIEAMTLGQRVAVLKAYTANRPETLQQVNTPSKLYEEPRNLFVAGFIGSPAMNLVLGHLEGAGGSVEAVFGTTRLEVDASALERSPGIASRMNQDIVFGIRPGAFEDARIAREQAAGRTMEAEADVVEILGPETLVHFEVSVPPVVTPDIEELLADTGANVSSLGETTRFTARISSDADVAAGQRVRLAVDTRKIHFFDPDTGLRI
ncbi:MAG: sn-glycerol-3-phosphate ABC transporter ATP-binding protein UgpC [Acidimicrobiia bacterium]